jgi:hypothetical protein
MKVILRVQELFPPYPQVPKIVLLYSVMKTTGIKKIHWRPAVGSCPGLLVNQLIYREYSRKTGFKAGQNVSIDDPEYWATAREVWGLDLVVSPNDKSTNTDRTEFPYQTTDHSQSFFFARNPFITRKWGRENSNLKFVLTAPGEDAYFDDRFFSLVDRDDSKMSNISCMKFEILNSTKIGNLI